MTLLFLFYLILHNTKVIIDSSMKMKHYPSSLLVLIVTLSNSRPSFSSQNEKYDRCSQAFHCGLIGSVTYPFFDGETRPEYCGQPGFKVGCLDGSLTQINVSSRAYFLQNIDYLGHTITVNSTDIWDDQACPKSTPVNYTVESGFVLDLTPSDENITYYYDCKDQQLSGQAIKTNCSGSGSGPWVTGYYLTQAMLSRSHGELGGICKGHMFIPIHKMWSDMIDQDAAQRLVRNALESGFDLEMNIAELGLCESCVESGGECGYNWGSSKFVCFCPDQDQDFICKLPRKGHSSLQKIWPILKVVLIVIAVGTLANLILCRFFYRSYKHWRNIRRRNTSFGPKRYSYSCIKKMTNSFSEKLGEGGYGPVFKGTLDDGCLVAVKLWKQSSGDVEEFLNEVASISRTNHANIVVLLGFCFEGHKQALVYEFMPNGSLEKFVRGTGQDDKSKGSLPVQTLFRIATGVARGLQYLHQGCDTRILHFDIKPHNILLDAELNPKISDFGMARSCTRRKSTISMSAARGTAGYIAPEVFFRNYGHGVSHKSDVYSYGMMILEILGQRKNDGRVRMEKRSSSVYFPQWIYARLEKDEEGIDFDGADLNGDEEDQLIERKMVLVGLWCIQTNPLNRPSMSSVVEMLRGKLESLKVPPMPSLTSFSREPIHDRQQTDSTDLSLTLSL